MNILILGSGGREHALAWKISQSPQCSELFIAPGNAGTAQVGQNVNIAVGDFDRIEGFIRENNIEMVVVGPEDPLVNGIREYLMTEFPDLILVGPGKQGAELEGSKDFCKAFLIKNGIPTAASATFDKSNFSEGIEYINNHSLPVVLKADGLAAGKGVLIINDKEEAKSEFNKMINEQKFGAASLKVVVEEYLTGIELSVFVLLDGDNYIILPEAKDYKRIGEGDTGLNTGGMGAVSPVPFADSDFMEKVKNRVIEPTVSGLKDAGIDYKGFLFIGLMNVDGEPYVIEYNVRMGDPETEAVIPRIKSDLVDWFRLMRDNKLNEAQVEFSDETATTVILVSEGYPESYKKGKFISGLDFVDEVEVFHAGTLESNGNILTNGGRVIAITALSSNMETALENCYIAAKKIDWAGKYYRKDIGFDLK